MRIKGCWLIKKVAAKERGGERQWIGHLYIELPSLDILSRFLAGDHDDELGDFTPSHPLVEL